MTNPRSKSNEPRADMADLESGEGGQDGSDADSADTSDVTTKKARRLVSFEVEGDEETAPSPAAPPKPSSTSSPSDDEHRSDSARSARSRPSSRAQSSASRSFSVSLRKGMRKQQRAYLEQTANLEDSNVVPGQRIGVRKECNAIPVLELRKRQIARVLFFRGAGAAGGGGKKEKVDDDEEEKKPQFTVEKDDRVTRGGFFRRCPNLAKCFSCHTYSTGSYTATRLGMAMINHINWMFHVSFVVFFLYVCFLFYALVVLFAGFITAAGNSKPECVLVGGDEFGHAGTPFWDAFSLSWHTFSTVGYGSAFPALSGDVRSEGMCSAISFICVIESFVGIMFGAMVGSILFGKITRIQSRAQVLFSDPVLIRYGPGVRDVEGGEDDDDDNDNDEEGAPGNSSSMPCPVLEFRIANRLFDEMGGEILDASLTLVASLDTNENQTEMSHTQLGSTHHTAAGKMEPPKHGDRDRPSTTSRQGSSSLEGVISGHSHLSDVKLGKSILSSRVKRVANSASTNFSGHTASVLAAATDAAGEHQTVEEGDPTNSLAPPRVFSALHIEAPEHPFFKRVWLVRHVMDETSPLLTTKVRHMIRKNHGHWPVELSDPEHVRDSLQVNQILVSLNGVSNVSGSTVYAQKVYDYVDLAVGYEFVNILYRGQDQNLKVDLDLINDVREQDGGGGEDLLRR